MTRYLSLTPDREWNPGDVGRIPWDKRLQKQDELAAIAREQYKLVLEERVTDPVSPYYGGALLLPPEVREDFFYDHPHTNVADELPSIEQGELEASQSFSDTIEQAIEARENRHAHLKELQERANEIVYDSLDISSDTRKSIATEIKLRGNSSESSTSTQDPGEVLRSEVESLVHHVAMMVIDDAEDGIVPLESLENKPSIYEQVLSRFEKVYGDHTDERMAEIDEILGSRSSDHDAYPNLKKFLSDGLFEVHINQMEKTPILWRLTTDRLVSDSDQEGFGCYIDYRSMDSNIFDRLQKKYLEAQKADLRERRNTADRRRSDEALPTSEQAAATEEYERCMSSLSQIELFEETLQNLASSSPRDWTESDQKLAKDLLPKVNRFYEQTQMFLQTYDKLIELNDEDWLEDTFSQSFIETIENNKQMWLSSLDDLRTACEAYSTGNHEPIPAHLYDLFIHFEDELVGSVWPTSTGVLAMGYYPQREAEKYLNENGEPKETLSDETAILLARIAAQFDEYESLADEIESHCQSLSNRISSSWKQRALSEITTRGYQPIHKHGVRINITPLAEAEIVPKIVNEQVI